jgi:hypothetical protein
MQQHSATTVGDTNEHPAQLACIGGVVQGSAFASWAWLCQRTPC